MVLTVQFMSEKYGSWSRIQSHADLEKYGSCSWSRIPESAYPSFLLYRPFSTNTPSKQSYVSINSRV